MPFAGGRRRAEPSGLASAMKRVRTFVSGAVGWPAERLAATFHDSFHLERRRRRRRPDDEARDDREKWRRMMVSASSQCACEWPPFGRFTWPFFLRRPSDRHITSRRHSLCGFVIFLSVAAPLLRSNSAKNSASIRLRAQQLASPRLRFAPPQFRSSAFAFVPVRRRSR